MTANARNGEEKKPEKQVFPLKLHFIYIIWLSRLPEKLRTIPGFCSQPG
jgi:hypothetical protein